MDGLLRGSRVPVRQLVLDRAAQPVRNLFTDPLAVAAYGLTGFSSSRWFGGGGATGTYTTVTGATDGPPDARLTSYKRKTWTVGTAAGTTGDTGFDIGSNFSFPATVGTSITVGWWMRAVHTGVKPAYLAIYHQAGARYYSSMTNLVSGVWTWVEKTYTVPASRPDVTSVRPALDIGTTSATPWLVGDTLDVTGVVISLDDRRIGSYYDGSSYNWRWTGTVDASESVGYPEPAVYIRNMHPNPSLEAGSAFWTSNTADAALAVVAENPRTGMLSARSTRGSTNPGSRASSIYIHNGGTIAWRVMPGETVSASAHFRPELAGRFARIRIVFRDAAGTTITNTVVSDLPVASGVYTRHSHTQVAPAGSFGAIAVLEVYTSDGSSSVSGERVWMDDCTLVNGPDPGMYYDGSFPGWRWDGVVGSSTSIGPPYTLEQIAGAPLAVQTAVGSSSSFTLGTTEDRSLYVVFDVVADLSANLPTMARIQSTGSDTASGSQSLRLSATAGSSTASRFQSVSGATAFPGVNGSRTAGRHIGCVFTSNGTTVGGYQVDSSAAITVAITPGMSTTSTVELVAPTAQGDRPIAAYAFRGQHDATTRKRIMTWLAWRYTGQGLLDDIAGAPIAEIIGVGTVALTETQMPRLAGRSTYVVVDKLSQNTSGGAVIFAEAAATGVTNQSANLRISTGELYEVRPQFVGGGGSGGAYGLTLPGQSGASGIRSVIALTQPDGLTSMVLDGNLAATPATRTTPAPGTGWTPGLTAQNAVSGATTYATPVYAAQFLGQHDDNTRKRIMAWLARRYGATPPAGY